MKLSVCSVVLIAIATLLSPALAQEGDIGDTSNSSKRQARRHGGEPISIFNDEIRKFTFRIDHEVVDRDSADDFVYRMKNNYGDKKPSVIGAYADTETNSLVVIGLADAESAIRQDLAEWLVFTQNSRPFSLEQQKRKIEFRRRELLTEMAGIEITQVELAAEATEQAQERISQLDSKMKEFNKQLSVLDRQLAVAERYLERVYKASVKGSHAADLTSNRSPAVNGLRGRMLVLLEELKSPSAPSASLRYKVVVELANSSTTRITVTNQPQVINVELLDENGKAIPQHGYDQDGKVPFPQWAVIPRDAYLGLRVDMPGVGLTSHPRIATLALGDQAWRLAPGTYTLRAQLLIDNDPDGPDNQWTGQLQLLPVAFTFTRRTERKGRSE